LDRFTEDVVSLAKILGKQWTKIGELLDEHPERVRSAYRRWEGTHEAVFPSTEQVEADIHTNFNNLDLVRFGFITDEHHPYVDPIARELAMMILTDFDPHVATAGSDAIDFYAISSFDKNPERIKGGGVQKEINAWKKSQREWREQFPDTDFYFLLGNHEDRWRRYLWRHPEFEELDALKLENLLDFESFGIQHAPDNELVIKNRLLVHHGDRTSINSAYGAKLQITREFYSISMLMGHTHKGGVHYATTRNGIIQAHECFCLCELDPEYMTNPNWQQGITLAEVSDDFLNIEPVLFQDVHNYKIAIWRGNEYKIKRRAWSSAPLP
jgi:hypothetical protein